MENHAYDSDDLDRYLRGEMAAEEKKGFEQQLDTDTGLAAELDFQRDTVAGINLDGSQSLKEQLQAVEAGLVSERTTAASKKAVHIKLTTWMAIAASLLTVVLLGYLLLPGTPDTEAMFVAYYEPYPNIINPARRSGGGDTETILEQAVRSYEAEDYKQAVALFEQGTDPSVGHTFYQAASYLGLGQSADAIPLLQQVAQEDQSVFYEAGLWYLALSHLKEGNTAEAKTHLTALTERGNDYATEAEEVLSSLD